MCVCSEQSGESDIPDMLLDPQHRCLHEKSHIHCLTNLKLLQMSKQKPQNNDKIISFNNYIQTERCPYLHHGAEIRT